MSVGSKTRLVFYGDLGPTVLHCVYSLVPGLVLGAVRPYTQIVPVIQNLISGSILSGTEYTK